MPSDKPLYCSRAGRFYSVHNSVLTEDGWQLHEVKPSYSPVRRKKWRSSNGISGTQYPIMRHFGCINCHILMALTWLGQRPTYEVKQDATGITVQIKAQIDHLNGNILDFSADNLQYVTPAENRRRAASYAPSAPLAPTPAPSPVPTSSPSSCKILSVKPSNLRNPASLKSLT